MDSNQLFSDRYLDFNRFDREFGNPVHRAPEKDNTTTSGGGSLREVRKEPKEEGWFDFYGLLATAVGLSPRLLPTYT